MGFFLEKVILGNGGFNMLEETNKFEGTYMTHEEAFYVFMRLHGFFLPVNRDVVRTRIRLWITARFNMGEDITKEEACIMIDCTVDTIPKMKAGKRNYRLRRMLRILTREEMNQRMRDKAKLAKINRGTEKIFNLIERGVNNVAVAQ